MLDLTNLIQNVPASADALTKLDLKESTDFELDLNEELDDCNDSDVDPHSFILLMANVVSQITVPNEESATEGMNLEDINGLENKAQNKNTLNQLNEATIEPEQLEQNPLEQNVALAWIDAEGFEAPKSSDELHGIELGIELPETAIPTQEMEALLQKVASNQKAIPDDMKKIGQQDIKNQLTVPEERITQVDMQEQIFMDVKNPSKQDAVEVSQGQNQQIATDEPSLMQRFSLDVPEKTATKNSVITNNQQESLSVESDTLSTVQNNTVNNPLVNQKQDSSLPVVQEQSLEIPVPVDSAQWADQFSEHIVWLGNQGIKSALIKIHPEELGPLEINVKVVNDSASVSITSHNPQARDIVDQAMPRLREMMIEQGLNLAEVHVGVDSDPRQYQQSEHRSGDEFAIEASSESIQTTTPLIRKQASGLIDYFA